MFTDSERRSLFLFCRDHIVATCCGKPLKLMELAADLFPVKHEALCPTCRRSLIEEVREHLRDCSSVPANLAAEAQRHRERARILVKEGRQLQDLIDVNLREAEAKQAELEARRRRLASDPPASDPA